MPYDARMRRRLKLRDLDTLIAVAETGSMAKAAIQLAVSQPAVSKTIADMERNLGHRLFDRTARGVEANIYGKALLKWGIAVFDDLRQGIGELEHLADPSTGELSVAGGEPIIAGLLPVIMTRLTRQYSGLTFRITQLHSPMVYDALRERTVDILVSRISDDLPVDEFDIEILFNDPQFVTVGEHNPLTRRRKIELRELLDELWTLPGPETVAGKLSADAFRLSGLAYPRTRVICNSIQMHNALLATGPYLAMYPRSLLWFASKRLATKVLPVKLPELAAPVAIIRLKNRTISPVAQLFIECAHEVAKPLARPLT